MSFLHTYQLDIMLFMSGICGILAVMTLIPKFTSRTRRSLLALMETASMMLLLTDRLSYIYRGDTSDVGWIMVRITNGMVFFLTLLIPLLVTYYMQDLYLNEGGLKSVPKRLKLCVVLFIAGSMFIIVSQFNGFYYTFDAQNHYQRSPGLIFSYIIPFLVVFLQEWVLIEYRDRLHSELVKALAMCIALPALAAVVQYFHYGLSLTNMTMVLVVIVFYVYALTSLGEEAGLAKKRELEYYKTAQKREAALFLETMEALANAIDAKDRYTRGHSTRVAVISRKIAKEAGLSDEECEKVYFSALLHDVGKIGVRDEVINKPGRLTDEEYAHIKTHPVLGYQILSSIKQSPYLSIGAHYHHERYDGKGYPDGLSGEDIPEIARIIAVADAYDAMSSTRSYRNARSQEEVRDEIVKGMGRQFDERFAAILLRLMDEGLAEEMEKLTQ